MNFGRRVMSSPTRQQEKKKKCKLVRKRGKDGKESVELVGDCSAKDVELLSKFQSNNQEY